MHFVMPAHGTIRSIHLSWGYEERELGFTIQERWAMEWLGDKRALSFFHCIEAQRHVIIEEILAQEDEVGKHHVEALYSNTKPED